MEVISPDQSAFLPMRYILDNIVLTQETLNWAKTSKQPLVLMKLDFAKAYDRVSWYFLFRAMEARVVIPGVSRPFGRRPCPLRLI
jgi:hypothetical protein